MTEGINRVNTVRAVGTLDRQRAGRGREESTLAPVWNAVHGLEISAVLQVRSPFGTPFQLPLRLDELVDGRELLTCEPGMPLRADGTLEWLQREDPRYAMNPTERGRRIVEVQFRPQRIIPAIQEDEPGCDVWLEGVVRRDARRYLHPDRRLPIAVVSLLIQVECLRRNSLARLIEPIEVQVAIPVDHPDVPKLIRRGNRVNVEGMLERVVVLPTSARVMGAGVPPLTWDLLAANVVVRSSMVRHAKRSPISSRHCTASRPLGKPSSRRSRR